MRALLLIFAAVALTGCLGSRLIIYQKDGKTPAAETRIGVLHRGKATVGPSTLECGTDPGVADGGTTVLINLTNRLTPEGAAGVIGKGLEKGVPATAD